MRDKDIEKFRVEYHKREEERKKLIALKEEVKEKKRMKLLKDIMR